MNARAAAARMIVMSLVVCLESAGAAVAAAQPTFRVTLDEGAAEAAPAGVVAGRLVVYLVDEASSIDQPPSAAPFFSEPQPMLGVTVDALRPGESVVVGGDADVFPAGGIAPGSYRVQAVLDRFRLNSQWSREPGNLVSGVGRFELAEGGSPVVELRLGSVVPERELPEAEGVEYRSFESRQLSAPRGRYVAVNAGVILPIGFDAASDRRYPVVYQVPGFGGDHGSAARQASRLRGADPASALGRLARSVIWVVLDPEGPNGHHLFLDSRANGPVGRALVEEVVPAIDSIYPTVSSAEARLLRGHSSGGWTVIHLALAYPETFGGAWSSAPDPLDFRAFQAVDIYADNNMYTDDAGEVRPSYTDRAGVVRMTIADENAMETVMGPANTAGQQWDSWQAAFGGVDEQGRPARLYDERTGSIDREVAASYRRVDLAARARRDPAGVGRIARDRVRVIVGDADEFDLDAGVRLLAETLGGFEFEDEQGWYAIVPGATHGSVLRTEAGRRLEADLADAADDAAGR
ncbi:MAG: alpha/beta hydrolase-fold protein [Planctomycetota bacterium]